MAVPDPTLGIEYDFPANDFRAGIRFVYGMAAAPKPEDQVTFCWPTQLVYNTPVDDEDVPFDPSATVSRVQTPGVKVPCSVEYFDAEGQPVAFGMLTPSRVVISLLDEDHELVKTATFVVIAGDRYNYRRTEPPSGLFDVGLFVTHWVAENET